MAKALTQQELLIACRFLELDLAEVRSKQDVIKARNAKLKGIHPDHGGEGGGSEYFTREIYAAVGTLLEWIAQGRPDLSGTAGTRPPGAGTRQAPPEPEPPPQPQQREQTSSEAGTYKSPRIRFDLWRFFVYYRMRFLIYTAIGLAGYVLFVQYSPIFLDSTGDPSFGKIPLSTASKTPLHEQTIRPLFWGAIAGLCVSRPQPGCERVEQLIGNQAYTIINCAYGPLNPDGTGWKIYTFWNNKVPSDLASYAIPGDDHPFLILGTKSVPECPKSLDAAMALFQQGRLPSTAG